MKVAVTSQGTQLQSAFDPRFGRAPYFIVIDTNSGTHSAVDNSINLNATQGTGIQAGKKIVELGVEAVVTGHVGPKASTTLQAGNVRVYATRTGTVAEALELFQRGAADEVRPVNVEGHWS